MDRSGKFKGKSVKVEDTRLLLEDNRMIQDVDVPRYVVSK